jgi:hypothetical protein
MLDQAAELPARARLSKDLRAAAATMVDDEARYLVDAYYIMQDQRIRASGQLRAMKDEPNAVLGWVEDQASGMELQVKAALERYAKAHKVGSWLMAQVGIGPVIAAGLLAHLDIHKAQTAGAFWSFAGLSTQEVETDSGDKLLLTKRWEKGTKRPFNATLKTLCWKIGESFVKVSGNENAFYGRLYAERKALETERNERGDYARQASHKLATTKIGKTTDAYKAYSVGKLPPAHIHARAKRYSVKMLLSHLHEVWYEIEFGEKPPKPFAISILGHAHYIAPPDVMAA